jgi:hypothetical protein
MTENMEHTKFLALISAPFSTKKRQISTNSWRQARWSGVSENYANDQKILGGNGKPDFSSPDLLHVSLIIEHSQNLRDHKPEGASYQEHSV